MLYRNLLILLILFAKIHAYQGCIETKSHVQLPSKDYDLNKPAILVLNDALVEISGIYFYAKDSTIFAISDENGYLYKIHPGKTTVTRRWKFSKTHDFEDVTLHDSIFYVLESNGNIYTLRFSNRGDTIYSRKSIFPEKKKNEFESIYWDDGYQKLIMICKDCKEDKKGITSAWGFDPQTEKYTPSVFTISSDLIQKRTGETKFKFKPSGATINPLTNDLWIISAINQIIVVTDRSGNFKDVYTLDPKIFRQPEGITFTSWGDLIISNEAGDKYGTGNLFIFKLKKNS